MEITPIKNEATYRSALAEIDGLMTAKLDTPEGAARPHRGDQVPHGSVWPDRG